MLRERFFEKLAKHDAFIQRLVLVLESRNQTARVEIEQRLGFVVRIHFDVLVLNTFLFQRDPNPLHEGTKPA
jgi:hypothetical protein